MPQKNRFAKSKAHQPTSRSVRIFLSSTFRDFSEERDLLVRQVFPALRAKLKERMVELVDVDLRWGITVEQAERGEVLPICLAEIDRARPYFVGMLGERYGWIPPVEGFAPVLIERQPWLKEHRGSKSVTELEILHGVLNNPKMAGRAFFYFRSAAYAKLKGGDYVPSSPGDRQRQQDLKQRIRKSRFPVVQYRDPQAFARRLERDLWKLLDAEFPADAVPDAFEREAMRHEAYAAPRRRLYLGGERCIRALTRAVAAGRPRVLIEGASGGGKSALLANALEAHRKSCPKDLIHVHYLGASADAADPHALVRRLIESIRRTTGSGDAVPADPQEMLDSLPTWLATASAWVGKRKARFVVVLDALNSLTGLHALRWLPAFLPSRVQLVVSCLPGEVLQAVETRTDARPWTRLSVKPLTPTGRKALLVTYLARFNKTLPAALLKRVLGHELACNPLFIRTLAEELRLFGVHEELEERVDHYMQSRTVDDLFERVLERVEGDCGQKAVRETMTAIWASRAGLSEEEILGIANLVPATWAAIRNALDEALLDANGRLTFAHDYLRSGVKKRYLITPSKRKKTHASIASWFSTKKITARRIEEEAYQLRLAGDWATLRSLLTCRKAFCIAIDSMPMEEFTLYWTELGKHRFWDAELQYKRAWSSWSRQESLSNLLGTASLLSKFFNYSGRYGAFAEKLIKLRRDIYTRSRSSSLRIGFQSAIELGELYRRRAEYKESSTLYTTLLLNPFFESVDDSLRIKLFSNLSELNISLGNISAAKEYLDQARTIGASSEKGDWYFLAELDAQKAWLYFIEEKFTEGEKILNSIISKVVHRIGKNAPLAGKAFNNLALILYNNCKFKEAGKILEKILIDDECSFGENNFNTILDRINLGWVREALGNLGFSRKSYNRAWLAARDSLGASHPSTLLALSSISWINVVLHGGKAKRIAQSALSRCEKILGKSHADTITPRRAVVWSLIYSNDHYGARQLASLNEKVASDCFGDGHSHYAACLFDSACTYEAQEKKSFCLANQALEVILQSLGEHHLDAAIAINALGVSAAMSGNFKGALNAFERASSIQAAILTERHTDRLTVNKNLRILRMSSSRIKLNKLSRFMAVRRYFPSSTM